MPLTGSTGTIVTVGWLAHRDTCVLAVALSATGAMSESDDAPRRGRTIIRPDTPDGTGTVSTRAEDRQADAEALMRITWQPKPESGRGRDQSPDIALGNGR